MSQVTDSRIFKYPKCLVRPRPAISWVIPGIPVSIFWDPTIGITAMR